MHYPSALYQGNIGAVRPQWITSISGVLHCNGEEEREWLCDYHTMFAELFCTAKKTFLCGSQILFFFFLQTVQKNNTNYPNKNQAFRNQYRNTNRFLIHNHSNRPKCSKPKINNYYWLFLTLSFEKGWIFTKS